MDNSCAEMNEKDEGLSIKPSQKTVLIKTFGCSLNHSDSETMAGILKKAGFNVINEYNTTAPLAPLIDTNAIRPDAVIINSCTVKNHAEKKFFQEIDRWDSADVKVIAAGCVPQAEPELLNSKLKDVSVVGTRQLVHVVDIVNDTLNGKITHNISNDYNERLELPKIRKNSIIEIIPISEGCLSNCSYCKTKMSRGELLSYPKEKIISQFKSAISEGCKEFWLTSQDNGCYGFDIYRKEKYFLPQLLSDLLAIDGDFRIRVGMANPDHILRIKDDLVNIFRHPKVFKFLHIPIQSGNNKVLKLMRRTYTVEEFMDIVASFREEIPDISISTDIIVGFPGENDDAFDDSMKLLEWLKPDVLNLSRFWLRKGTYAEKLPQVLGGISKERSEKMRKLFDRLSMDMNKKWIGDTGIMIIDDHGKDSAIIARNDYYRQVVIKDQNAKSIGCFTKIKIIGSGNYDLLGQIVD
jgi:threonylcarbamoyladenosine tRNA methylthiotransferase CDKAL1